MASIIINESFDDDLDILEKLENKQFESSEILSLRLNAEKISNENQITELISYPLIKKNLQFQLPHQKDGAIKLLRDLNGTGLLADEVGLGKTITAGLVLKEGIIRGFVKKALVLCPPSLVDQWVSELKEKFELEFKIIEQEEDWTKSDFIIASIDRVKTYNNDRGEYKHNKAHQIPWDILIVDEAHKLKDKNTRRWDFVDKIQKKRFLILTATPFQNDLLELYNLLNLLKRGHLGTLNEFKKNFFHKGNKRHPLNPHQLKSKLQEVMVRRKREETSVRYMKRIPKVVPVKLSQKEREIYDDITYLLKEKYLSVAGGQISGKMIIYSLLPKITSSSRSSIESLTRIAQDEKYHFETRQMAYNIIEKYKTLNKDSKIEKLVEIVREIINRDSRDKILIYTKHPTTLSYIVEKLKPFNLKIVEYVGGLEREEKSKRVKEFKESANIMISTETGSEGLNFQFCNNLINYDLPWNPMAVEQRIGRLDRIGQKKDMYIYSLATKDTMEEKVVDLIINKMCCIGLVIGELPIILFNLGYDSKGAGGMIKIEEMLMNAFINSKNNLSMFETDVDKINENLQKGITEYLKAKENTTKMLDPKNKKQEKG